MNERGLSLLETVLAMGIMVVGALFTMRLTSNIQAANQQGNAVMDKEMLKTRMRIILSNQEHLNLSASKFTENEALKKSDVDEPFRDENNDGDPDEGHEVIFYLADHQGNQLGDPIFQAGDRFGSLELNSIRLFLTSDIGGQDYPEALSHTDMGMIRIYLTKNINKTSQESFLDFPIGLTLSTNSIGETTVVSASNPNAQMQELCEAQGYFWDGNDPIAPCSIHPHDTDWCSIEVSHYDHTNVLEKQMDMPLNLENQGWHAIRLAGDVGGDDSIRLKRTCPNANPTADYIKRCQIQYGWRDQYDIKDPFDQAPQHNITIRESHPSGTLNLGGDVNGDDAFYLAMLCPQGGDALTQKYFHYFNNNCRICLGHSDNGKPQPEHYSCTKINAFGTMFRTIIRTTGNVNGDDLLFYGFSCKQGEMTTNQRVIN